jgi:hypothetical protein
LKKELKLQLKAYDMGFMKKHRRMPVKSEKEPIRHLYEQYNQIKERLGGGGSQEGGGGSTDNRASTEEYSSKVPAVAANSFSSSLPSSPSRTKTVLMNDLAVAPSAATANDGESSGSGSGVEKQKQRKEEKLRLHNLLRQYEKDFHKKNGRNVSSFNDIRPVSAQYQRYKELKKMI